VVEVIVEIRGTPAVLQEASLSHFMEEGGIRLIKTQRKSQCGKDG
jgi:hypothetical protein